ncbi:hypothetical protein LINPERHAP1_LOCUS21588, partial [Linum perenne]
VFDFGPWTFDSQLLILHELRPGEQLSEADFFHVDFWFQVHDLNPRFYSEAVARILGDFVG